LKKKPSGLKSAKSKEELISELADVIEVIEEIKKVKKNKSRQISVARKENMFKKGGFKKKLFLVWASDTGYKSNEKRYKK